MAIGVRADGSGVVRVARTQGIADAIRSIAPGWDIEEVDVAGPPTSASVRAAGWAEASVVMAALSGRAEITAPNGARAGAEVTEEGVRVRVACGEVLDEVVLRSYCVGAAHMALGWVTSEGIRVDETGEPRDLTIRSFGILRATEMPSVRVEIEPGGGAGDQRIRCGVRRGGSRGVDRARLPTGLADTPPRRRELRENDMSKPVGPYTPVVRAGDWLVVSARSARSRASSSRVGCVSSSSR